MQRPIRKEAMSETATHTDPAPHAAAHGSAPAVEAPTHLRRAWEAAESHCIKCGFCLPACPTYAETGREASSPRGRLDLMYSAARGELPLAEIDHQLSECLGCLACETACPSGIRYRDMLEAGRIDAAHALRGRGRTAWLRRRLLNGLLLSPRRLRLVVRATRAYQRSGLQRLVQGARLLRPLPALDRLERSAPPVARLVPWRRQVGALLARAAGEADTGGAVALQTGCVMDVLFGEVHAATVKVLRANGVAVHAPAAQTCCGALHLHAGEEAAAQALARRNIAAFEAHGEAPVIVNSAGCGAVLKDYPKLLADDPAWHDRAAAFSARVVDVCAYLAGRDLRAPEGAVQRRVAYDDPCHLLHAQGVRDAPREVLGRVPGLELVPLPEADRCCGSAGSYSLTQPEMSGRVLARKMRHVAACGAEVVASGNPGCLLQLRRGVRDAGLGVRVQHPVELLAEAYG